MNAENILKFLKSLARNNNRDWFEKNKDNYLILKEGFETFVGEVLAEMIAFDSSLSGLDPKRLTYRIYRDVRFSKDKTPYKTNMSAAISSGGKTMGTPGYYFQLEPNGKSFVAAGLYVPQAETLAKVRQEIDYNGDRLQKILKDTKFKKYYAGLWDGDSLKSVPKGYAKDHPQIELLKLKSFLVEHPFSDEEVTGKTYKKKLIEAMRAAQPLVDFLKEGLD
ncbi:DUF2461 domain-containing protein [Chryseolinea sp. T2]|uniref:DUF2461 domain-containing protein n=1 Tax=Chryseolinea sp. T2 TaxID=3129255 RepID=UPI0030786ECF